MYLKYCDSGIECVSFQYNHEESVFEIRDRNNETVLEYVPVLKLDPEYKPQNFQYLLLKNEREDYSESSIFQVYVEKKRIGWIFPIQALLSDQHVYANDPYFLKYAYIAIHLLIQDIDSKDEKEIFPETMDLSEFYEDRLTILVLDNENISKIGDFSLKHYTVSLYQNGYSYVGRGNLSSEIRNESNRINLKPLAKELRKISYIHTLFEKEIPKEQEAFAKFHIYYQVIEILISVVFEDKFGKFVEQLSMDTGSLFDRRDELGNMVLEKQRVKWLFSNYVKVSNENIAILDAKCRRLLGLNGKKEHGTMAENLYAVRCLLVHSMYMLDESSKELLNEINDDFLDILMEMLLSFSSE